MGKKPFIDTDAFPEGEAPPTIQDREDAGEPVNSAEGGISGTRPIVPTIIREPGPAENYIPGGPGAPHSVIVFGPQRNTNIASGMGKAGLPSDTIDLVAGLNAGGIAEDGQIVGVNPITDAARVYITKRAQVDTMFQIAREVLPGEDAEPIMSAVVMKADLARIFGTAGVKIVTGRAQAVRGAGLTGEKNSKGGPSQAVPTIDLIAGNMIDSETIKLPDSVKPILDVIKLYMGWEPTIEYLQPIPKGDNLRMALEQLGDIVQAIAGIQMTTLVSLAVWSAGLAATFGAATVPVAIPGAMAAAAGQTGYFCAKLPIKGITPDWSIKMRIFNWQKNYTESTATRYINSRNVRTT